MYAFEKEENIKNMLDEMKKYGWETDVDENSTYKEIQQAYKEMKDELDYAEYAMYPNGRDYDAENFDD